MNTLQITREPDGIAVLTLDLPGRPMNVLSPELIDELDRAVTGLTADPAVTGILLRSGKKAFVAGADLVDLVSRFDRGITLEDAHAVSSTGSRVFRRLETCGKPVAVAINGVALGGGFELCLACHHRVLVDEPQATVGFPEVKLGLLPGGGGTQRLLRMLGREAALPLLLEGSSLRPGEALRLGLVDEVVPRDELEQRARAWLRSSPEAVQPWDRKRARAANGGLADPATADFMRAAAARVAASTRGNYPAQAAILSCVFEGEQLPIDAGLAVESKYFATLLTNVVSRNMMRTLFIAKGRADKLAGRPKAPPKRSVRKLAVVGAGMMGTGIACAALEAGMRVAMLDRDPAALRRARDYIERRFQKEVVRGRLFDERAREMLEALRSAAHYDELAGSEVVIEAVFEDRAVKSAVLTSVAAHVPPDCIFGTNTSTLPITGLQDAAPAPERVIGVHFFSPAERMPLVEVITGARTSDATLAAALDFVVQLRKTPIVVHDSRGFFTSRVFATYTNEGMRMLEEGVSPALIENAAELAGMPVGPLAVSDEVTIDLQLAAIRQAQADLGAAYSPPAGYDVMRRFVEQLGRTGRRAGGGFYEYAADGRKWLWPGLSSIYPRLAVQPSVDEVRQRLLYVQSLESARCLEEGVLRAAEDADVGSVLGWSFPSYTGGAISLIDTVGVAAFVDACAALARRHGPRFEPSPWLHERAACGRRFYEPAAGTHG